MAYSNLCCRSGGSNLNSGTRTGDTTEPGTAADFNYPSGTWVAATGVFTVASGNPLTDGVAVGDFCSVYPNAATVTPFVGRCTARDATTITVSLTAKAGTAPVDGTANTTLKVGGAWKGPNAAVNFPFGFIQNTLTNAAGDFPRVNFKNDASYSVSAAVAHANAGPILWQGFTVVYGDLGKFTLDAGGGNFSILTFSGANNSLLDAIVTNNGTGTVNGVVVTSTGNETYIARVVVHDVRASGFNISGPNNIFEECEAYLCNVSNTSGHGGFLGTTGSSGLTFMRCIAHDNATANSSGFRMTVPDSIFISCIADSNGSDGFNLVISSRHLMLGCEAYSNGGDGVDMANTTTALFNIENCNFIKNGGWGINGSGAGTRNGSIRNCRFGAGTQANTSGTMTGLSAMADEDNDSYAADVTPWVDPANGDFRINLAAAKGTGRGSFTQTQASYTGTVAYPDIGAGQQYGGTVPAVGDVRSGVAVGSSTGTLTLPTAAQVLLAVGFGASGTEFTGTIRQALASKVELAYAYGPSDALTGTVRIPTADKARLGYVYGAADSLTGTLTLPTAAQVLLGTAYGADGTEFTGTIRQALASKVELAYAYGPSDSLTGTVRIPPASKVELAYVYGASDSLIGTVRAAAVSKVELSYVYGDADSLTGTVRIPTVDKVQTLYVYGASDSLTGTLSGGGGGGTSHTFVG